MQSRKVSELEPVVNKNGITGTKIYVQPEGEIVHLHLSPGAHLAAHTTPVNVAFYVLEGTATFVIGDEEQVFPQDTIVDSPKDIPHAVLNNGDSDLRLLVIKMPKP
ncbi:MAG: cupin domain-containing protein [Candidatus Cloacimonadaceae bacterium]|jgi:quercetin dioxygenase-like cupin family protein|nr:cupin domain-containing protein [Candidatus Syntrophosphaera sp.]NLN85613.1 cupin domain-containing protein [Candidatus Cloacimonadota bacterium]